MLYGGGGDAFCSENHTKHKNALRGQNIEFLSNKPGKRQCNQEAWKDQS
jgi:hypothetical protein